MAYVRKTDDIWRHIESRIGNMFAERQTHADNWYSYGLTRTEFDTLALSSIISDREKQLMEELGARFFKKMSALSVSIPVSDGSTTQYKIDFSSDHKLFPAHWESYYDHDRPVVNNEQLIDIAKRRREKSGAVSRERAAMVTQVKEVWGKVPSVNRFIKVWPPGRDLLDTDTLRKLDEKTEREAAEQIKLDDAELSKLNTNLLRARVAA